LLFTPPRAPAPEPRKRRDSRDVEERLLSSISGLRGVRLVRRRWPRCRRTAKSTRIGATWSRSSPPFSCSLSLRRAQSPRVGSPSVPVTEYGGQKVNVSFSHFGTAGSNQLRDPRLRSAGDERLRATGLIALLFLQKLVRLRTSAHSTHQSLCLFALLLFRPVLFSRLFLEQKKLPGSRPLWRCSSRCYIPTKSQRPKLAGTLPCAALPATELVSILQPKFLRVVWSEDARGVRVPISTLTKKSADCWKPRGTFPRRIARRRRFSTIDQ
jgi:hypothetical protein